MADVLEARREEFITLLARENGKILGEAAFEIDLTIPKLRYYAALALADHGGGAEVKPGLYSMTLREASGVAGVIVPWNSPVVLAVRSFAPALAAGCTVAMKLPGQTGLVNGLLSELVAQAESLPAGVMNVFTESGNEGAPLLVSSPDVDVISYTGSTMVGRKIMEQAAATLKSLSLELGGKTPMVVFDDADLNVVVPVLTAAITTFAGQFCMTGSRILAQRGIADELRRRMIASLEAVKVGPGDDPASQMGAMIDEANAERVERFVADAADYATVLVKGARDGAFIHPSLVEVADLDAPIVQKEVFGPVATFEVFDTEAEAVERANATEFGLAASVWTRDVDRPLRVGREIKAGTVWTNTWAVVHDMFEEGGFKQSGMGRLNGVRGLEEFQETKHLVHPVARA
jgi:acyl-CoA reductase-like NAD-dependent aldehyde dehydrogenase